MEVDARRKVKKPHLTQIGETALITACKNGEADLAAMLLAGGSQPTAEDTAWIIEQAPNPEVRHLLRQWQRRQRPSFIVLTYNILAKSLGSNCIPWMMEVSLELRSRVQALIRPRTWDEWRREALEPAYKLHFHKNLLSGDYTTMRELWGARHCRSPADLPSSLTNVRWVAEDTIEYSGDGMPAKQALTLRGVLRRELAADPALALELFDHVVSKEERVLAWHVRGPRIFNTVMEAAMESAEHPHIVALQEYDIHHVRADYRGKGPETFADAMSAEGCAEAPACPPDFPALPGNDSLAFSLLTKLRTPLPDIAAPFSRTRCRAGTLRLVSRSTGDRTPSPSARKRRPSST